jgi:hypothetical protein
MAARPLKPPPVGAYKAYKGYKGYEGCKVCKGACA